MLRRVCPELVTVGTVQDGLCDVNTNAGTVLPSGILSNTQRSVTVAAAGTVYPNATINDDWFIQLFYFNQTTGDGESPIAPNINPNNCKNDAINNPADLTGGDHAGFVFTGTGLPSARDYVVFNNVCPTDDNGVLAGVAPELYRTNTPLPGPGNSYNPFGGNAVKLSGGTTVCTGAGIGANDYFILQFTAQDIYAMYNDGNAANGDAKKDFIRQFFGNNCNAASKFTWDFGAMTLPENTDVHMLISGMQIFNYKEDVSVYNNLDMPGSTAVDLGFTIDGNCDGTVQTGAAANLPAWLTPAKLANVFEVTPVPGSIPGVNDCYDVYVNLNELIQPNCNDTCYNFEIGHTIEKCGGDCPPSDNKFVYTRCISIDKKPNLVAGEPADSYFKLGCVEPKASVTIATLASTYKFSTDICNPTCGSTPGQPNCPASCSAGCFAAGGLTVPAPFDDYVINDGTKLQVLPTIITALAGSPALAAYIAAVNADADPSNNYPTLMNGKRFYIPFIYTV